MYREKYIVIQECIYREVYRLSRNVGVVHTKAKLLGCEEDLFPISSENRTLFYLDCASRTF